MPHLTSVAGLCDSFDDGPLTVNRPGLPTKNARGAYEEAVASTFDLEPVLVVQQDPRRIPGNAEADRNEGKVCFVAPQRIHVADQLQSADRITWEGRVYRITDVENYRLAAGLYIAVGELQETGQP